MYSWDWVGCQHKLVNDLRLIPYQVHLLGLNGVLLITILYMNSVVRIYGQLNWVSQLLSLLPEKISRDQIRQKFTRNATDSLFYVN